MREIKNVREEIKALLAFETDLLGTNLMIFFDECDEGKPAKDIIKDMKNYIDEWRNKPLALISGYIAGTRAKHEKI